MAKDYAEAFLTLLVIYRDVSASEAAARLNIHIKTAQDFLVGLEEAGILEKREAAASVEDIMNKAGVERDDLPEILDLIDILTEHKIIEKRAG